MNFILRNPFGIAIVFLTLTGSWKLFSMIWRMKQGYRTTGKVLDVKKRWAGTDSRYQIYYPLIQLKDKSGKIVEQYLSSSFLFPIWNKGEDIPVVYFNNQIYNNDMAWPFFYGFFVLTGIVIIIYHLITE